MQQRLSIDFLSQIGPSRRALGDACPAAFASRPRLSTTKAWSEAYKLTQIPPLGDEEERVLWPHGVCAYSRPIGRSALAISDRARFHLNRQLRVRKSQDALDGGRLQTSPLELGLSGMNRGIGVDSTTFWVATNLVNIFFSSVLSSSVFALHGEVALMGWWRQSVDVDQILMLALVTVRLFACIVQMDITILTSLSLATRVCLCDVELPPIMSV